jgi:hypothetical protein
MNHQDGVTLGKGLDQRFDKKEEKNERDDFAGQSLAF